MNPINWNRKVAPILVALQAKVQLIGVVYPSGAVAAPGRTDRQRRQWIKHRVVQDKLAVVKTSHGTLGIALVGEGQVITNYSQELKSHLEKQ